MLQRALELGQVGTRHCRRRQEMPHIPALAIKHLELHSLLLLLLQEEELK